MIQYTKDQDTYKMIHLFSEKYYKKHNAISIRMKEEGKYFSLNILMYQDVHNPLSKYIFLSRHMIKKYFTFECVMEEMLSSANYITHGSKVTDFLATKYLPQYKDIIKNFLIIVQGI